MKLSDNVKGYLGLVLILFVVGIILWIVGYNLGLFGRNKAIRTSKPRCKCGTQNCNDSNCDPGVERMVQVEEVAATRTIPLEMPPSRR